MSHFGNSLTTGYETLIQQRVAAWLLNTPDGKKLVEETLAKVGPVAFGNRLTGKGAVALGTAVLNFRPGDQSSNWGPLCDQEFVDQLNQLVLKDQFLSYDHFKFSIYFERPILIIFGKAVVASTWWAGNKMAVRKAYTNNLCVKEVLKT